MFVSCAIASASGRLTLARAVDLVRVPQGERSSRSAQVKGVGSVSALVPEQRV